MDTCMSPPQQQQPQPQSDHIMQQPQLQQQSWSQGSQHSSSGHAVTAGAPHQTHGNLSDMGTQRPDGSTLLECKSLVSLGEHPGQSSVGRAASSMEEKADRQQEMGRQQEMHGRLGWHGSAAGGDTARTQVSSSTFLDGLRPGSPSQRCSPEAAARATPAHLLAAGQGNIGTKGEKVADLQVNNEALLCMLERERQHSQRLAETLQQAEANALEGSLEQAVQMEEGRLAAVALRSKCRKLESESLFADVFEKYEEEIRQLQAKPNKCVIGRARWVLHAHASGHLQVASEGEVYQLKQTNTVLGQQLALHEVEGPRLPHPRALVSKGEGEVGPAQGEVGSGQGEGGQGELRLQALRKQLKRSAAQCDALKAEVAEGKRRDRTAILYKKKATDGVRRVSELQKEVAHLKQQLHSCRLAAVQAAEDMSQLQDNKEFVEAEHVSVLAANQDLQASVDTLREQVRLLRSQRQRAVVLAHLPALRPEAHTHMQPKGPSQGCAALDVARRLQLEPAQTPKMAALIERVADQVHLLLGDRCTLQQRESILMDLLTGFSF
ncbi:hypothetical protein ABBQ38_002063 [Trebouxia sp. C0009 RCD-2024]